MGFTSIFTDFPPGGLGVSIAIGREFVNLLGLKGYAMLKHMLSHQEPCIWPSKTPESLVEIMCNLAKTWLKRARNIPQQTLL